MAIALMAIVLTDMWRSSLSPVTHFKGCPDNPVTTGLANLPLTWINVQTAQGESLSTQSAAGSLLRSCR
jgi:hypothetical protein